MNLNYLDIPFSTTLPSYLGGGQAPNPWWPWLGFYLRDEPLDLSLKCAPTTAAAVPEEVAPQILRTTSVIHSTKSIPLSDAPSILLPTCSHPEISLSPSSSSISSRTSSSKKSTPPPAATSVSEQSPNRMSYPREFKLMVIEYFYSNGLNKYRTCKEFQITKSMLNGWLAKAEKIRQSRPGALKSGRSGRKPQFPEVEKKLFALYLERVNRAERVGNRWLRETARCLANELSGTDGLNGMCQFSERWLSNFKRRYAITPRAEKNSGDKKSESENSKKTKPCEEEDASTVCSEDHSSESSTTSASNAQMAQAILHQAGQLPIQAFYEKFPWLCRKATQTHEEHEEKHSHPRGRKVQFPEVEKKLFEEIQKDQSQKISNKMLQEKAREIAKNMNLVENSCGTALFSEHWILNFKKRFNLVNIPRSIESL